MGCQGRDTAFFCSSVIIKGMRGGEGERHAMLEHSHSAEQTEPEKGNPAVPRTTPHSVSQSTAVGAAGRAHILRLPSRAVLAGWL